MDWISAIGYQHEVLHTSVLAHLLKGDRGSEVASRLLGDEKVAEVSSVQIEQRVGGKRPVDLAGWVADESGKLFQFAVETKVDSAWTPKQLKETVVDDCVGVLLAVGYTALAVTHRDLEALTDDSISWSLVRPAEWGAIVRDNADGDAELEQYARRVLREADEQKNAINAVVHQKRVLEGRNATTLEHWAYFHEVIHDRSDVAKWERKTLRSGPLLTLWVNWHEGDRGDYLEFMGDGEHRSLCVKTFAPVGTGAIVDSQLRLQKLLSGRLSTNPRPARAHNKTCTAARWWLDDYTPAEANDLANELKLLLE